MTRFPSRLALMLGLIAGLAAMPLSAGAQQKKDAPKAAPAARAAPAHAAPAARPAPHPAARAVAPRPAARAVAPHPQPRRAAAPHPVQRAVAPHVQPHRAAAPVNRATVNRAAQRHERAVQRAKRSVQQAQPKAAATPSKAAATAKPATSQAQTRATTRAQQRAERALRRREDRALRNTPKSQRAAKRQEIQRARAQRTLQRQQTAQPKVATQATGVATPNAAVQSNAQTRAQRRALRRNRAGAVTAQAARQGRFASAFANRVQAASGWRARHGHYAAHRAWRHGLRAAFIPWYGPVFWPYAYSDIFDYAFWPYGYDDDFWAYAYDDFIDGLFWGEAGPPDEYVEDAVPPPSNVRYAAVEELCTQPGTGITAWPFAEMERKLTLSADQKALLGEVRDAANKAAATFKSSCPSANAFPLTPPGRLRAMTGRLQATLEAVETVRPALEKFYASLSDEQKERFNELGPAKLRTNAEASAALPADTKACAQAKPGLTNLPIEQIDEAVKPTEEQGKLLDALETATGNAVSVLQAACPEETPLTPPGRLQAMETRLKAMIEAANTVKPGLDDFYASLSNEQKARFNRIGRQVAESKS
jgi:LTXXQ motif family protein